MLLLIAGLVIFLGLHSLRIFAEPMRTQLLARFGDGGFKAFYSVVSIVGFALIWYGYGQARMAPSMVWNPPMATRHIATLLTLVSFIILFAAYVPRNRIKRAIGHPMVIAVKVWAFAHLLANGMLADIVLFGSFLLWAVLSFRAARGRDKANAYVRPGEVSVLSDVITIVAGIVAWVVFAIWLHGWLIGVKPFG
ncbi:MAG: NnrU family protein [Burkholderiaceae bacterium]